MQELNGWIGVQSSLMRIVLKQMPETKQNVNVLFILCANSSEESTVL